MAWFKRENSQHTGSVEKVGCHLWASTDIDGAVHGVSVCSGFDLIGMRIGCREMGACTSLKKTVRLNSGLVTDPEGIGAASSCFPLFCCDYAGNTDSEMRVSRFSQSSSSTSWLLMAAWNKHHVLKSPVTQKRDTPLLLPVAAANTQCPEMYLLRLAFFLTSPAIEYAPTQTSC